VEEALQEGFGLVSIDTWLAVIPQIIARIHTNNVQVRPTGRRRRKRGREADAGRLGSTSRLGRLAARGLPR
jgi:hypothetical protein